MKERIIGIIMLVMIAISSSSADETALCVDVYEGLAKASGEKQTASISPAQSDVYALQIYVTFPDVSGQDDLPNFYTNLQANIQDFFEEMSYYDHHVHLSTAIRPSPNQTKCYVADYNVSHYVECFLGDGSAYTGTGGIATLTTEILQKVYNDDKNAFVG